MIVHHPQWQLARKLYRDGAIGKLVHVDAVFSYDNRADAANIRNNPATGGGSVPDIGVYTCGSTRFVTGEEPTEVVSRIQWENDVDVTAQVSAQFPGFTFSGLTSMRMHPRQEMVFHGEQGILRLPTPFNAQVFGEAQVIVHRGMETITERFPAANHYVLQVENFSKTLRAGEAYPCPLEFSQGTQRMIDMIFAGEVTKG